MKKRKEKNRRRAGEGAGERQEKGRREAGKGQEKGRRRAGEGQKKGRKRVGEGQEKGRRRAREGQEKGKRRVGMTRKETEGIGERGKRENGRAGADIHAVQEVPA
ncbi:MAG: hypothetical protein GX442_05775 [Candidatus Riflebacteria bacterium]|nr:hypothetical protein [Candidatus Riflebacteria bacterium]